MKYEAARCAQEIKKLLKEKYPGTKFRVKSEVYSGGDSVRVYWDFGPTNQEIDHIIDEYQDGDFDGMEDLYNYRKHEDDNKPRAKYVFSNRQYRTPEEIENEKLKLKWNDPKRRDLWKEEKTFYHVVTRDLCALFGLEPMRPDQQVPEIYRVMSRGGKCYVCWSDVIHSLLHDTPLMTGYHGVKLKIYEDGTTCKNVAEAY